jgi:hypothetical protein
MAGIGGAFFVAFQQNIYPSTYTVADSVNFLLYCFLGGLDYLFGPVVGAFLLVISFELLHAVQDYQALIYGALMILCMAGIRRGPVTREAAGFLFASVSPADKAHARGRTTVPEVCGQCCSDVAGSSCAAKTEPTLL